MRIAFLLTLAACGKGHSPSPPDARPSGVQVTGCDDPTLWDAPAIFEARLNPSVGGGACSPAQYPLHRVHVGWSDWDAESERTCWRVTAASAASGWVAGDTFVGDRDGANIHVKGFESTLTIEGRVLASDGTVLFAVEPGDVKLRRATVLESDALAMTTVLTSETWVESNAVHFWNLDAATDEIVDATNVPVFGRNLITVHRTASGFVHRAWGASGDQLDHEELALGPGARARIAKFGSSIVIDSELLSLRTVNGVETVLRTPLAAEPLEIAGGFAGHTVLHLPGSLVHYDSEVLLGTIPVGDGVLLPVPRDDAPYFFDGATFHRVERSPLALGASFTPRAEELAAIGTPRAVMHDIVFGERGLLVAVDRETEIDGPRVATFAELFGDRDARLGPVAVDSTAYVMRFGDGTAKLVDGPFVDYCE